MPQGGGAMLEGEYAVMAAAERSHWWYRHLRWILGRSLKRHCRAADPLIVDIGCGTGGTARCLRESLPESRYLGIDPHAVALSRTRSSGAWAVIAGSVERIPLRPGCADAVLALDSLCFAADLAAALAAIRALLKPGGLLLVNLPAFEALRGRHDLAVGLSKRFQKRDIEDLLTAARFEILGSRYWNAVFFLPLLLWRRLTRLAAAASPRSDLGVSDVWCGGLLEAILKMESALPPPPFGSSLFIVARRGFEGPSGNC